jgi:hypothetical protein
LRAPIDIFYLDTCCPPHTEAVTHHSCLPFTLTSFGWSPWVMRNVWRRMQPIALSRCSTHYFSSDIQAFRLCRVSLVIAVDTPPKNPFWQSAFSAIAHYEESDFPVQKNFRFHHTFAHERLRASARVTWLQGLPRYRKPQTFACCDELTSLPDSAKKSSPLNSHGGVLPPLHPIVVRLALRARRPVSREDAICAHWAAISFE